MPKINIMELEFDSLTLPEAAKRAADYAAEGSSRVIVTPNAEIAEACYKDSDVMAAVKGADMAVPDGAGVVLASKILGTPVKCKVAGVDLANTLLPLLAKKKLPLYLLGAKPGVAEQAARKMQEKNPGLILAGTHDGYFDDDAAVIAEINAHSPAVLFVALGSPRQELWMHKNRDKLRVGVMIGLGGSLDIFAGVAKRAPKLFIKLNLEWLYRLLKQPWRIGRMMRLPRYLLRAFGCRLLKKNR